MTDKHNPFSKLEHAVDSLEAIKQTCSDCANDITKSLIILKDMKAKYPATFHVHGLEQADALLRKARAQLV